MSALGTHSRVNDAVDEGRTMGGEGGGERRAQFVGRGSIVGSATEGLYQLVVAGIGCERRGRRICTASEVGVVATVYAAIVEHHHGDGQSVAADGLDLHTTEAEGAVALDSHDLTTTGDGCRYGIAHADTHDAPCAAVEAQARTVHIDDVARVVERVGTLVHHIDIFIAVEHIAHCL